MELTREELDLVIDVFKYAEEGYGALTDDEKVLLNRIEREIEKQ